jgi:septal ring factor EnvC (AmiA/AmiB activator)
MGAMCHNETPKNINSSTKLGFKGFIMTNTNTPHNSNGNDSVNAVRERMAAMEATQSFHQESLKEISMSLREVIKTQHTLANQSKEIGSLADTLSRVVSDLKEIEATVGSSNIKAYYLTEKVNNHHILINNLQKQVNENSNFTKFTTKVIGIILIPLVIAVFVEITKLFF